MAFVSHSSLRLHLVFVSLPAACSAASLKPPRNAPSIGTSKQIMAARSFDSPRDMRQQQKGQAPPALPAGDPASQPQPEPLPAPEEQGLAENPAQSKAEEAPTNRWCKRRPGGGSPPGTPERAVPGNLAIDTDGAGTILAGDKQRLLIEIIDPGSRCPIPCLLACVVPESLSRAGRGA